MRGNKRIKAMIKSVMMATVFPLLRTGGTPEAVPAETAPEKSPEERIKELEGELEGRGAKITELESQVAKTEGRLKQAIAGYKNLIIGANPEILPELISGESLAELEGSLARARELTARVRSNLEAQTQKKRIPAGAPPRGPEDVSGLSAREKISRGIRPQ